jgi:hypothetical protein
MLGRQPALGGWLSNSRSERTTTLNPVKKTTGQAAHRSTLTKEDTEQAPQRSTEGSEIENLRGTSTFLVKLVNKPFLIC